jgi:hypothetical protein
MSSEGGSAVTEAEKLLRRLYAVVSEHNDLSRAGRIIRETPPQGLLSALMVGARALSQVEQAGKVPAGDGRAQALLRRVHELGARREIAGLGRLVKKQLETDPELIPTALILGAVAHHGANDAKKDPPPPQKRAPGEP